MATIRLKHLVLASAAVIVATPVLAQTAPAGQTAPDADRPVGSQPAQQTSSEPPASPSPSAEAGDIVVTAQRREQRLQDVPISVAVTTGETITKSGTTDLLDLATRLPSVHIGTGVQSNNIIIRGAGSGLNAGFEQSVGVFVDGVYRPRSRTTQAGLFDVERVEVLNGPQTTFFGNNTIAGAINITSKKPSQTFGYDAQALYVPTDGQYVLQAGVTAPLSDTLSFRVAGQASGMNGYTYNRFLNSDGPHLRDEIVRGSLRWEPTAAFRSDLRVDYARNRDRSTFNAEITGCPPPVGYPTARGPCSAYLALRGSGIDNALDFKADTGPSTFRLDLVEAAWTNRYDFGPVALNSISSYSHSSTDAFIQATPLPVTGVAGYFYNPFRQLERYSSYSQELRLESTGKGWLQYVAGLYYSHGHLFSDSYASLFNSATFGTAGAPVTSAATPIGTDRQLTQTDQTRSAFAQVTVRPLEGLSVAGGLRYTSVKKDATRRARAGIGAADASDSGFVELDAATQAKIFVLSAQSNAPFATPDTTYSKLLPSASLTYAFTPRITGYATYSKGFKAGGYSDSNTPAQFDSENVDAYEIGLKGSLFDRAIFFTLDGFYEDYSNLQQALSLIGPSGALITTVGNAASSTSKGVEASVTVRITPNLTLNGSASYIRSQFNSYPGAACTILQIAVVGARCIQDVSNRPTPFAPRLSGSEGLSWTLPVRGDQVLRVEPNLFYSSSYYLAPTDDELTRQKSYVQTDFRLGYGPADHRWEVAVIGKNLNDAKVKNTSSAIATAPGLAYSLLQRARSVAISVSIRR